MQFGLAKFLALRILQGKNATVRQAAKIAGLSLEEMLSLAFHARISVVDYDPRELSQELRDDE